MTQPTINVAIALAQIFEGAAVANAQVRFELTGPDLDGSALMLPKSAAVVVDANGVNTAKWWPNARGSQGTQTRVTVHDADGRLQFEGLAVFPAYDCTLTEALQLVASPSVSDAQRWALKARDWAISPDPVDGEDSAKTSAGKAHADRLLADADALATGQDRAATAADRVQTGNDRTQTGIDAAAADASSAQASSFSLTAIAQAGLAALYAMAASSAVAQDLSGTVAAALHRSPTPVVQAIAYYPAKDSNPNWPTQVDASYVAGRTLNGAWLDGSKAGPAGIASEFEARCYGATLGTVDGLAGLTNSAVGWTTAGAVGIANGTITLGAGASAYRNIFAGARGQFLHYRVTVSVPSGTARISLNNLADTKTFASSGTYDFCLFDSGGTGGGYALFAATAGATFSNIQIVQVTALNTTSGSYYQNATDGKFYRLNDGVYVPGGALPGQTETFDGNTGRFPAGGVGIVAEASRVVIYDLLAPGRPMWMVFTLSAITGTFPNQSTGAIPANGAAGISCIAAQNGSLLVGRNADAGGVSEINFARDRSRWYSQWFAGSGGDVTGNIAQRNTPTPILKNAAYTVAAAAVNAVAMATMPDAPIDPVTGLSVPTVAVATAGGVSVIKHDGSVVNSAQTGSYARVGFTNNGRMLFATLASQFYQARNPSGLAAGFAWEAANFNTGSAPAFGSTNGVVGLAANPSMGGVVTIADSQSGLWLLKDNQVSKAASLTANIRGTYNTGWLVGDIRRCLFSDVSAGVAGLELVTVAADRDFSADTGFWTKPAGVAIAGGVCTYTAIVPGGGLQRPGVITAGLRYKVTFTITAFTAGAIAPYVGGTIGTPRAAVGTYTETLTAGSDGLLMFRASSSNTTVSIDDVSCIDAEVADRSYKAKPATIAGPLTKTAVAAASQLVFWSGFSAANYAQEAYNADYDVGAGGFALLPWVSVPALVGGSLPSANFPRGAELCATGDFASATGWTLPSGWAIGGGTLNCSAAVAQFSAAQYNVPANFVDGGIYEVTFTVNSISGGAGLTVFVGTSGAGNFSAGFINAPGTYTGWVRHGAGQQQAVLFRAQAAGMSCVIDNVSVKQVQMACLVDHSSAAAGASWRFGVEMDGNLAAEVFDTVTTRRVVSPASYAGAGAILPELTLSTSGALTLKVNGKQVAQTTGAPLLTLNNAAAVTTWGNRRTLDAAFPGSIALARFGATVPTDDQSDLVYQQERAMFRPGAQVTLPDAGALVGLSYDPTLDRWRVVSAANECEFSGLVRVASAPAAAGSISGVYGLGGAKLITRTTANPGVDVTIPPRLLPEELLRKNAANDGLTPFEWSGGFTGAATINLAQIGSAAPSLPLGATLIGAQFTAGGFTGTRTFTGGTGSTLQVDAAATASTASTVSLLDYIMPLGWEPRAVFTTVAGVTKRCREGAGLDYSILFDGFRYRVRFVTAPGATAIVSIDARQFETLRRAA